jgi:hypothetical protein
MACPMSKNEPKKDLRPLGVKYPIVFNGVSKMNSDVVNALLKQTH